MRRVARALSLLTILAWLPALAGPRDLLNPPILFERRPADDAGVDFDARLVRRIKADPTSFNPILMFTAVDAEFDYLIWDRPFVIDAKLRWSLNRSMATRYEESKDHRHGTLTLRDGLKWHDGHPFTAEDIAYSWSRIVDERVICRKAGTGADQIAGCVATSPTVVQFEFKRPLPTNCWNVDFPIIARHLFASIARTDPTLGRSAESLLRNRRPIGNGPYRLKTWDAGERIVLERWEDYPGPRPAFQAITFRIMPDNNTSLLAFEAGQVDEMELTPHQFAREAVTDQFATVGVKGRGEQWTTYYIGWNVDGSSPFLADRRVRQALSHAIDTRAIIDRVFFGLFTPGTGLFHPSSMVGVTGVKPYAYDLARSARLLDESGWRIDPDDGWRYRTVTRGEDRSERLRAGFVINLVQGSQTSPRIADIVQADLRKLGVEMSSQVLDWSVFNERNFKHEFAAFLSAWTSGPEPDDAWNLFHSTSRAGGRNYCGYVSPQVDALLLTARRSFSVQERTACYRGVAAAIHADVPCTFLVNANTLWAFNRRLRGVQYSPRGPTHFYPGILAWWTPVPSP